MTIHSIEHQLTNDEQLCFIRVQKTGSSTLTSIVDSKFHVDRIWSPPPYKPPLPSTPAADLELYDLFRGHFGYDIRNFLPKKPVYITMLRHPIQRVISLYKFYSRRPDHPDSSMASKVATSSSIEDFVRSPIPQVRARTSNCQAHQIASGFWDENLTDLINMPDADLLDLAKDHLDQFAFVGLTERFNESILLLSYIFGWYPAMEYQSLRVSSSSSPLSEIDPGLVALISDYNSVDLHLYDYAQTWFESRFSQMVEELLSRYRDRSLDPSQSDPSMSSSQIGDADPLETLLNHLERHYERRYAALNIPKTSTLDFDVSQPMSGSGWHRRNGPHNGLRGNANSFRWTGPGTLSTLDFPLVARSDLLIRVHISNAIAPDVLESLSLRVNDQPIILDTFFRRGLTTVFQGRIPQSVVTTSDRPMTRLTFEVNRTDSPQAINPNSPDRRFVGVALSRLQIFPIPIEPEPSEHVFYPFPENDPYWLEAVEFIRQHIGSREIVAAPGEFYQKFPDQFCSYLSAFYTKPELTWVIVHQGLMDETHFTSMKWAMRSLYPVFINPVFVILSRRRNLPRLSPTSKDWMSFKLKFWLLDLEKRRIVSETQKAALVNVARSGYRLVRKVLRK
ncbi:MAG: hypothetical protein ACFE0I_15400 [Elainellaceae cyanobacterium]